MASGIDLAYDDNGLLPVVAQSVDTRDVLMLAYANEEAIEHTLATGYAHYYSRSRDELWKKGETSGHTQTVTEIRVDCDADTLLYLVEQQAGACHRGYASCFYRTIDGTTIQDRVFDPDRAYDRD